MARIFARMGAAIAALALSAQAADALVTAPTYLTPSGQLVAAIGFVCINPDLSACTFGGGGGGGASYTAASGPFAVTAGINKPAFIDTANSAQGVEICIPGTTTCVDPTGPSGIKGLDGSAITSLTNPTPFVPAPNAGAGMSTSSAIVANNTTSVAIDASPGTLYAVRVWNIGAAAWLKLYDAAQGSTTCGSGTPKARILIPANSTAANGGGATIALGGGLGVKFSTAITRCVTTGIADADTSAPAASTYVVEADYK